MTTKMKQSSVFTFLFLFISLLLVAQKPDAAKAYNVGLEYYNLKNYEAAIPFLKDAIKKDPNFYNAYRSLISCLEQAGKEEELVDYYEKCISIAPSEKGLVYNFSQLYIKRKEYEKALIWLRKALEIDPAFDKAAASLKSVEEYLAKKNNNINNKTAEEHHDGVSGNELTKIYNEALGLYKEAKYTEALNLLKGFKDEVSNSSFYYLMAITYQQLGSRENAIDAYERTLELDDRHFDANFSLGTIYYNSQRFDEALPLLETAYERRKNDRKLLYLLAKARYQNEDYKEAIPFFITYTEMVMDDAEAFFMLSKSYEKTGDKKKADIAFEQAKKLGTKGLLSDELSRSAAEYSKKASEHSKSGNYQQAISILEEAITKHSEQASLHYSLGLNYLEVGNREKAQTEFAKTVALDPAHAKAYQALGTVYYDKADYNTAITYYKATVDAGKQDAVIYYKLGNCYFYINQFADASVYYTKATETDAKEKQFFFGLALAHLKTKEHQKSIKALQQALVLDPNFLEAHYHICINYIELNEFQNAINEAEKIVAKNPNYPKAYLAMAHAYKRMGKLAEADKNKQRAIKLDASLKE